MTEAAGVDEFIARVIDRYNKPNTLSREISETAREAYRQYGKGFIYVDVTEVFYNCEPIALEHHWIGGSQIENLEDESQKQSWADLIARYNPEIEYLLIICLQDKQIDSYKYIANIFPLLD